MNCKTYKRLYKLLPIIRWRALLIDKHFSLCPTCKKEFAIENQITSIGITPGTIETTLEKDGTDLWPRVKEQLIKIENKQDTHSSTRKHIIPPLRTWRWALAGTAVLVLTLVIPFFIRKPTGGPDSVESITAQNKKIMINSITVENRPAKTIYFQPGNKDRLIVWVKKM